MPTADAILEAATQAQRDGKLTEARDLLDDATRVHAHDARIWTRLGEVLRRLRQYAESLRVLQHAVELAPQDPGALTALVEALRLDYRPAEALDASLRLMKLAPDDARARNVHALALVETDQPDKALPILNALTTANPHKGEYWISTARALVKMGRFTEADPIARKVTQDVPNYPIAFSVLAAANYGLLRDEEWMPAALRAHELDPTGPVPLLWMARIGERSDDLQREMDYLVAALKVQPRLVEARVMLGSHAWRSGDLARAERSFLEALSIAPLDGAAQGMLAQFRVETGRGETDLDELEEEAKRRPYSRLAFFLGRIFLASRKDYPRATRLLKLAAEHAPESLETLQLLGQAYLFDGKWQLARETLQRVVALCPRAGEAWRGIGIASQNLDDDARADEALGKAVTHLPESAPAHFDRGFFLARTGRTKEAIAALRRSAALEASGQTLYVLAEALERAGERSEALATARRAKTALPAGDADIDELIASLEGPAKSRS